MALRPGQEAVLATSPISSPLWSIRQLATRLGCSVRHVRRQVRLGLIPPPLRIGALVRWSGADIERWIENGCQPEPSAAATTGSRETAERRENR